MSLNIALTISVSMIENTGQVALRKEKGKNIKYEH